MEPQGPYSRAARASFPRIRYKHIPRTPELQRVIVQPSRRRGTDVGTVTLFLGLPAVRSPVTVGTDHKEDRVIANEEESTH